MKQRYATTEELLQAGNALSTGAANRLEIIRDQIVLECPADQELLELGLAVPMPNSTIKLTKDGLSLERMIFG